MDMGDKKDDLIVTEASFSISGEREFVYQVLEDIRSIISDVNASKDNVEVKVNVNTSNMGITGDQGLQFEDEATMIKWQDLQNSNVDMDAMMSLNRMQDIADNINSNDTPTKDILKRHVDSFTDKFLPRLLDEVSEIIKNRMENQILSIESNIIESSERTKFSFLKLGEIKIKLKKESVSVNTQELRQNVFDILGDFFEAKGLSKNLFKNIDVYIQ